MGDRIKFGLLDNALDYLLSAAELVTGDTPRSWKYALLHSVAGIELLLKARLNREHWSLLFANVDKASREALDKGDFVSIDFKAALERLSNITGVEFSSETRHRLNDLRQFRNQVQHFAIDVDQAVVIPLVAYGYHFCLDFLDEHMAEELGSEEKDRIEEMTQALTKFDEFVLVRLTELKSRLEVAYNLVDCPRCWQQALELGDENPRCLFCGFTDSANVVADEVSGEAGPEPCPECGGPCILLIVGAEDRMEWVCFQCGEQGDYEHCSRCGMLSGKLMPGDHCSSCWNAIVEKD